MITLKNRLNDGQVVVRVIAVSALASPKLVEMAGLFGDVHGVWFDQEHQAIPHHELEILLMACRAAGLDAFVRVAPTDYATIMRPMEAGASGVMAAQIRTVAEVQQIVSWFSYPPAGTRGLNLNNHEGGYGSLDTLSCLKRAGRGRWLAIQIETAESVAEVEKIAAIDGVNGLFVGPGDLACNLGVPGQPLHAKCVAALERIAAATQKAGKWWGVVSRSPEHADLCRKLGCRLFSLSADFDLVRRGFAAVKHDYKAYF